MLVKNNRQTASSAGSSARSSTARRSSSSATAPAPRLHLRRGRRRCVPAGRRVGRRRRRRCSTSAAEPISLRDLVDTADRGGRQRQLSSWCPFPPEKKAIDIGSVYADYSKITRALGWAPTTDMREGLERTFDVLPPAPRRVLGRTGGAPDEPADVRFGQGGVPIDAPLLPIFDLKAQYAALKSELDEAALRVLGERLVHPGPGARRLRTRACSLLRRRARHRRCQRH